MFSRISGSKINWERRPWKLSCLVLVQRTHNQKKQFWQQITIFLFITPSLSHTHTHTHYFIFSFTLSYAVCCVIWPAFWLLGKDCFCNWEFKSAPRNNSPLEKRLGTTWGYENKIKPDTTFIWHYFGYPKVVSTISALKLFKIYNNLSFF